MGLADEGQRIHPDDLFPHLDRLVSSEVSVLQIYQECNRFFQHAAFPPLLLVALSVPSYIIPIWVMGSASWLVTLSSSGSWDSFLKNSPVPTAWLWVVYISSIVFQSCAEVELHRAVVGAYLNEQYAKDGAADQNTGGFIAAVLRCTWSNCATAIVFGVIGVVVGTVGFLLRRFQGAVVITIVLAAVVLFIVGAFLALSLPVSALTTTSGFQALQRSFLLTRGNVKSCFGLYLTMIQVKL